MLTDATHVKPRSCRITGITLIEVLVAIGILGLLLALVVPAVQGTRESARRIECANHLRQIGIALNAYVVAHRTYPAICGPTVIGPEGYSAHLYSVMARLLPELDEMTLYNAANFTLRSHHPIALQANYTVMTTQISLFQCPSDEYVSPEGYGRGNYRFSIGPTPWFAPASSEEAIGAFSTHHFLRPSHFRDGVSNTIGVSERLQGDWTQGITSPGDYYSLGISDQVNVPRDPDWAVRVCYAASATLPQNSQSGQSWFLSGQHFTNYNHCAGPNPRYLDCGFSHPTDDANLHARSLLSGVFSARSFHSNGVHSMLMDGSVKFVQDGISVPVWRSLATRAGGEAINGDAW